MIVATAGHVDHGKTLLVKALTGVDTDRLPEEKKRGLTIDLGFAYYDLGDGELTGFVDVPGHEKFIRTMLAGVSGIDFVIFVVAADDGPMPQTAEHLAIMDLLGVSEGVIVISKIDRVSESRLEEVSAEVRDLLANTSLERAPIVGISALEGIGMDTLRAHLADAAQRIPARVARGNFRLAIDRSFLLQGAGRVVTGTVFSGSANVDDQLMLAPTGAEVRVRGIHAQNTESSRATAGQRCALNLVGGDLRRTEIHRGDWVVGQAACFSTTKFDAQIRLLPVESRAMRNRTPVHVHVGAADVTGRVVTLNGKDIAPGESALVQIQLGRPISLVHGDRLILRDQSALRTVGGGEVLDPLPVTRGRARHIRAAYVDAMQCADPDAALVRAQQALDTIPLDRFAQSWNLTPDEFEAVCTASKLEIVRDGSRILGLTPSRWNTVREMITNGLSRWHERYPDRAGVNDSELRLQLDERVPVMVYQAALGSLLTDKQIVQEGGAVRLPAHTASVSPEEQALWNKVSKVLLAGGTKPPVVHDLVKSSGVAYGELNKFLMKSARDGRLVRVSDKRFFMPGALRELIDIVEDLSNANAKGEFTVREYRDRAEIGRNSVIEILEYFDRIGYTLRIDQIRKRRKPAAEAFPALYPSS